MSAFPDWAAFTPEKAAEELPRLLDEAEAAVAAIESAAPAKYEDFIWALDDATDALWHCWGAVSHMLSVMNDEAWRKVQEDFQGRIVAFSLRVGQSKRLYEIARSLVAEVDPDPVRRRILEKMIQGAELAGVALEGAAKERFNEIQTRLALLSADFRNAVIDATTPEIADSAYLESMKHEKDRALRETLYRKRQTRAPENEARIVETLKLRAEMAQLLGFANYAELSLASKCAPGVAAVIDMIDRLDAATAEPAERERAELEANAAEHAGIEGDLEPWIASATAERIIIDHHPNPEAHQLVISDTTVCSTCELLYRVIVGVWGKEVIDTDVANALYTGINTDTGGLSHNSSRPETYRIIADLLELGLNKELVHERIYQMNRLSRLRLIGNTLLNKLQLDEHYPVAVMVITQEELERYHYKCP
jgi:hypothetical protein